MAQADRDWQDFALLLIDVQRDFWPEETARCFPAFPRNIEQLLALSRQEGIEVIHLRACFQPDRSDWMVRYRLRDWIPCVQDTDGAALLPCAVALPGETVMLKQTFDGFLNPQLPDYLAQRGKRFVLVAGLVTSVCVLLTAVSAAQRGFLTAVIEDCCADDPQAHAHTLQNYPFAFERSQWHEIPQKHSQWQAALSQLATTA